METPSACPHPPPARAADAEIRRLFRRPAAPEPEIRSAIPPRPAAPEVPQRVTTPRPPAVVPAPDRPLYTTEVTFTTPRETEAAAAPPIIGEPVPAAPRRDAVADPYTSVTHPGMDTMQDKKKLDPSVAAQQERRVSRGRPGGRLR